MRKLSNTRSFRSSHEDADTYATDTRQRRIAGATVTARPDSRDVDIFFARHRAHVTVTGAAAGRAAPEHHPASDVVSLSDGTQILFATAQPFETAKPA